MNIEEYRLYCISKKGVTESFPFPKLQNVLIFKVLDKMFTATDIDTFRSISVKADSNTIDELRIKYNCLTTQPYMSKKHWNKIIIDNSVSDNLIYQWIDDSYNLVVKNMTKNQVQELKLL